MTELNEREQQLVACYEQLAEILRDGGDDLAPFARANATKALAALWQIANGLDQDPGQPYEVGV